ncbi:protein transport protein Sec31A isoform X2 [Condylostylus longicornis]|uniref:protein transport protein Sec31A isoform X2 n=1 Tax=Condylostylus longicornis TaxID=2530218 RepID=UPI00244DA2E6|nr:protein transport protein Sec31A isoform X2 [Condylostylus longicornis]
MKIKELQKTVNMTWSPMQQTSIMLAAGTAAQQLDVNVSSVLEIYSANLLDPVYDLELKVSQPSRYKFQKLIWSPHNINDSYANGLIVGGCEGGHLQVFNASKLLAGENGLVADQDTHTGAIRGLDFNPFQNNLLASAASESEIFIWDLNNTSTPMAPGTKTQPLEDVQNVAWNRQVQHILSSVFSSRCVIWDLRKNEQIMKLSDSQSRVRWRAIQWHPEIATQLWLASEDDSAPFVQLWDLRYATAPAKSLQVHNRGILGLTWCPTDVDMMISCAKDNKILCWNPNSELPNGEILGEVATTIQWYSDVQWCPRNPALIASSSLEGNVSIYSLFGGTHHQVLTSNKIADSFPGMDQFSQAPIPQQTTQIIYQDLIKPPKWMKRKSGVSFGFGGKLITFGDKSGQQIKINQIVTETELVNRANALDKVLEDGNYSEYCKNKADQMSDQDGRYLWYFIKANFELNPREEMLNLLGYNKEDTANKFKKHTKIENLVNRNGIEDVTAKMATLTHGGDNNALFDALAEENKLQKQIADKKSQKFKIPTGDDSSGLISEAILSGNIEAAVDLCFSCGKSTEALIIASTAGIDFLKNVQLNYLLKQNNEVSNIIIALAQNEWINIMSNCEIESWKEALMGALTHSDARLGDLCAKLGDRLQEESTEFNLMRKALLCYICAGDVGKLVEGWLNLRNKKANTKLSTSELQDLVEIVMLLKKSLELRGVSIQVSGQLAEFLAQYAGLLATQGALDTALSYLGPTEDALLEDLRDRLYYALGHKQINSSYSRTRTVSQNIYGRSSVTSSTSAITNQRFQPRGSFSNPVPVLPAMNSNTNNFNAGIVGQPQQPWNMPPNVPSNIPPVPTFNSMQNLPQNTTLAQPPLQPTTMLSPPPPLGKPLQINETLPNPQRPSSVGSQGSGPLTRKYVVDPSVSSGPQYGQMGAFNPNQQMNLTGNGSSFQPYPTYNNQVNQNLSNSMPPANTISSQNFKPFIPSQPGAGFNSNIATGIPPVEMGQTVMPPPAMENCNPTPPPGWNDPPPLSSSSRQNGMSAKHAGTRKWQKIINAHNSSSSNELKKPSKNQDSFMFQAKPDAQKMAPITHPIFGAVDSNQNGYMDPNIQQNSNTAFSNIQPPPLAGSQIYNPNPVQPQQYLDNQSNFRPNINQMNFKTQAISQGFQQQSQALSQQNLQQMQTKQEPPKQKAPLPEEYIYMQTVLEELKNQCMNVAADLRTKKKIQDVTKRLQYLYDALREKRLSTNTINSLNQIVQFLQTGDYGNALTIHTQIVSGPDFSQTANFMPGIKVLVQTASELKIYLQ